jgi:hypothetical protein
MLFRAGNRYVELSSTMNAMFMSELSIVEARWRSPDCSD